MPEVDHSAFERFIVEMLGEQPLHIARLVAKCHDPQVRAALQQRGRVARQRYKVARMVHSRFPEAFTPGCRFLHEFHGPIEMATKVIGELNVQTGRIVACDPFTTDFATENEPLAGVAPRGVFPVEVAIANYDNHDARVACARVRFAGRAAVRWSTPAQPDQFETADGSVDGYGVDSGTGCFFDASAIAEVESKTDAWLAAMEATSVPTWSWHVVGVGPANVVMFSTGAGDGIYASYWGFDGDGEVVELVTDFELLIGSTYERIELALPLPRGKFRHALLEQHDVKMHVPLLTNSSAIIGGGGHARIEHPDGTILGAKRSPALKWYLRRTYRAERSPIRRSTRGRIGPD